MIQRILFWMTLTLLQGRAKMSNYTLKQWPAELGPLRRGDQVHLLCSVLFDPNDDTCTGQRSVRWLRVGSRSGIVQVRGKSNEECESPKRCLYKLSINVSESDSGAYFCALEACGNLIFGNGTKLDFHENEMSPADGSHSDTLVILSAILALSLLVIVFLLHVIVKTNAASVSTESKKSGDFQGHPTLNRNEDSCLNSAVIFTMVENKTVDAIERRRVR
ncbi:uncharacterized protein LOC133484653 isoform X1 [Phyllopteryx taeniolatus]|uniref:uncharacterized protein LOC133484653 isoform X1 n=2 Tax=Phyllopteryx taeniolatus TaxID=161469 RepID=UPI002AD36EFD|nr:uncharacterized protein LOC133484653 isoform X1 [Phyllopteryx taeniolatus]